PSGLVEDKTFENGVDNLVAWYGDSVATSAAAAHSGTFSLAITASGGSWGVIEDWPGQASVKSRVTYTFTAWVKAASVPESITEEANWVGKHNSTSRPVTIGTVKDSSAGWTELTGTATAPHGATSVALDFKSGDTAPGVVHYLDDVTVSSGAVTSPPSSTTTVPTTGGHGGSSGRHGGGKHLGHQIAVRGNALGALRSHRGSGGGR
ncbi:MAG: carbohydrate binding domain-containing protein, partial [Acidimicrobiaceae bacterium]|nr:carbohydrate binding domain-containing protein [Acidimicrobiaceae bacterium]